MASTASRTTGSSRSTRMGVLRMSMAQQSAVQRHVALPLVWRYPAELGHDARLLLLVLMQGGGRGASCSSGRVAHAGCSLSQSATVQHCINCQPAWPSRCMAVHLRRPDYPPTAPPEYRRPQATWDRSQAAPDSTYSSKPATFDPYYSLILSQMIPISLVEPS